MDSRTEILLDRDQLRRLADLADASDAAFLAGLYELFTGDARETLERMRELVRTGDAARLAREAHRLKGSSGSIGAAGFSRGCLAIERRARELGAAGLEGPIAEAQLLLDEAQRLLEATLAELRAGG